MTPHYEPDVHGMFDELTRAYTHREPYTMQRGLMTITVGHLTRVPSLVRQLLSISGSTAGSGDMAGVAYQSRPAARIEGLDTLMLIDDEAGRWLERLGEDRIGDELRVVSRTPAPSGPACTTCLHQSCVRIRRGEVIERERIPGSGTVASLNRLHGLLAGLVPCGLHPRRTEAGYVRCCHAHRLEHDVRRWWHQARIVSGWDQAAYRLFNTCPICETRGSLRIKLEVHAALCVECREVWDAETIGLLAEHVRTENGDDAA